ncbi:MAG: hypothetical protein J5529_01530 [Prevotella sp.]|nr:hypothetical protein [Prevotella sp.]
MLAVIQPQTEPEGGTERKTERETEGEELKGEKREEGGMFCHPLRR